MRKNQNFTMQVARILWYRPKSLETMFLQQQYLKNWFHLKPGNGFLVTIRRQLKFDNCSFMFLIFLGEFENLFNLFPVFAASGVPLINLYYLSGVSQSFPNVLLCYSSSSQLENKVLYFLSSAMTMCHLFPGIQPS